MIARPGRAAQGHQADVGMSYHLAVVDGEC